MNRRKKGKEREETDAKKTRLGEEDCGEKPGCREKEERETRGDEEGREVFLDGEAQEET